VGTVLTFELSNFLTFQLSNNPLGFATRLDCPPANRDGS
jgi:hypothetical protein